MPVFYPPGMEKRTIEVRDLLETGTVALSEILAVEAPELEALLVADADRREAPRENERPYPPGLPYLTGAVRPPALVLPEALSSAFRPRTGATWPLLVWHELAHAFLLRRPMPHAPAWLREFMPQALAAAVARRAGLLDGHLVRIDAEPGFTVRDYAGPADAERQMAFQNLLLRLGVAALEEFGEGFSRRLANALWNEEAAVGEARAEKLLAESLSPDGRGWLEKRPEF